jgi:TPR repeat protein
MLSTLCAAALLWTAGALANPYDDAQAALGRRDYTSALRLFSQAANQGNPAAEYNLGRLYAEGQGVPVNPAAAAVWFRKAADQGNPGAQYNLGLLYQEGRGVRRDPARAAAWQLKAANQGYADAEGRLAAMYETGDGVPADQAEAARWYRQAAGHGDASATLDLALINAEGPPKTPSAVSQTGFNDNMNHVFGPGQWRETGGYRSIATENRLRAEGALTVPVGVVSHHSMGTPEAPGAYDIVVKGMSPDQAATKIRRSGVAYRRLFPEGVHGTQGAHLHVEPFLAELREAIWRVQSPAGGRAPPPVTAATGNSAKDSAEALSLLRSAAARGDACATKALDGNSANGAVAAVSYLTLQRTGSCG